MFCSSQLLVLLFKDQKQGVAVCKDVPHYGAFWGNKMKE